MFNRATGINQWHIGDTTVIPNEIQNEFATLVSHVHAPIFFEKLASEYNIVANTEEEQSALLELAGILQVEKAKHGVKQASANSSVYSNLVDELKGVLNKSGEVQHETQLERLVKSAADSFLADTEISESAFKWGSFQMGK